MNEIIALEEQRLTGRSCERVGKTIAKIQLTCMSAAFSKISWPKAEEASRAVREYLAALDNARNEENGGDDDGLSGGGNQAAKRGGLADRSAGGLGCKEEY